MGSGPANARPAASGAWLPEQRVGGAAVRGGSEPVFFHADDFSFEQRDPMLQLILRIRGQVLRREEARRVAFRPGALEIVHCNAASRVPPLAVNGPSR